MFCRVNTSVELHIVQRTPLWNHVCRVNPCEEYVLFRLNTSAESCCAELIFFLLETTLCTMNVSAVSLRNPMMCPQWFSRRIHDASSEFMNSFAEPWCNLLIPWSKRKKSSSEPWCLQWVHLRNHDVPSEYLCVTNLRSIIPLNNDVRVWCEE